MPGPDANDSDKSSSLTEEEDVGERVEQFPADPASQDEGPRLSSTDSDSDMASKIAAAGEGESLLGSDDESDDDLHQAEEEYMIKDALQRERSRSQRAHVYPNDGRSRHGDNAAHEEDGDVSSAELDDDNDFDEEDADFWNSLPASTPTGDKPEVNMSEELLKPQRGFTSSPEPSFSDFFGSSDEPDANGEDKDEQDDDMWTVYYGSSASSPSDSSTISDICSLSAPLIAHVGAAQGTSDNATHDGGAPAGFSTMEDVNEAVLRHDVPLLVIEDLDGRLIYARAGDGEAVFGSDGEFEFAGDSDDESSSELSPERELGSNEPPRLLQAPPAGSDAEPTDAENDVFDTADEGDTTDELPDEDMPFPRLLIGSVAPRGGRNARRAREIAARTRREPPRVSSPTPSPLGLGTSPRKPSGLSQVLATASDRADSSAEERSDEPRDTVDLTRSPPPQSAPAQPATPPVSTPSKGDVSDAGIAKPEMGQFMPASSKGIHRAVIDGSTRAPSPFSTRHTLQHRGFGRKRSMRSRNADNEMVLNAPVPKRSRTMSLTEAVFGPRPEDTGEVQEREHSDSPLERQEESTMDLGDVLDEGLLYQEATSDSTSKPSTESESIGSDEARLENAAQDSPSEAPGPSGRRPSLNFNAFARWGRIPMGAFRESQNQAGSAAVSPILSHQRPASTFLLTQPFQSERRFHRGIPSSSSSRRGMPTLLRHSVSFSPSSQTGGSPLNHMLSAASAQKPKPGNSAIETTLSTMPGDHLSPAATAHAGDHSVDGDRFLVSPMLYPIKQSGRTHRATGDLGAPSAVGPPPPVDNVSSTAKGQRITKREKRERLAAREALKRQSRSLTQESRPAPSQGLP